MNEDQNSDDDDDAATSGVDFQPARFPIELGLPPADESLLQDAKTAVRQEFRDCSKWKRLRCRKVSVIAERDRGTVYALHVGSSVEFDWTWEGATAFRPHAVGNDGDGSIDMADFEESPVDEESLWSGEVLEVDERNGCLFISLNNPECPPTVGSFFVRPFEFLGVLDAIYHESRFDVIRAELRSRLSAAAGGVHPPVARPANIGLPRLRKWWQHSWSVLWGPPGTGKTYTTGQQIAGVLSDEHERILAVSTTNRATGTRRACLPKQIAKATTALNYATHRRHHRFASPARSGGILRLRLLGDIRADEQSGAVCGVQSRLLSRRSRLFGRHRLLDRERSSELMACRHDPQPL